jgi:molybdenum cofactor cytidylyltransferase
VVSLVGGGGKTSTLFRLANEIVARRARVLATTTTRIAASQRHASPAVVTQGEAVPLDEIARALDTHGQCLLVGPADDEMCLGVSISALGTVRRHARQLGLAAIVVEADGSRTLPIKAPAVHEPVVPPFTTHLVPIVGLDAVGRRIGRRSPSSRTHPRPAWHR